MLSHPQNSLLVHPIKIFQFVLYTVSKNFTFLKPRCYFFLSLKLWWPNMANKCSPDSSHQDLWQLGTTSLWELVSHFWLPGTPPSSHGASQSSPSAGPCLQKAPVHNKLVIILTDLLGTFPLIFKAQFLHCILSLWLIHMPTLLINLFLFWVFITICYYLSHFVLLSIISISQNSL